MTASGVDDRAGGPERAAQRSPATLHERRPAIRNQARRPGRRTPRGAATGRQLGPRACRRRLLRRVRRRTAHPGDVDGAVRPELRRQPVARLGYRDRLGGCTPDPVPVAPERASSSVSVNAGSWASAWTSSGKTRTTISVRVRVGQEASLEPDREQRQRDALVERGEERVGSDRGQVHRSIGPPTSPSGSRGSTRTRSPPAGSRRPRGGTFARLARLARRARAHRHQLRGRIQARNGHWWTAAARWAELRPHVTRSISG